MTKGKTRTKAKQTCFCDTCGKEVADSKVGFVCQHFAHLSYLTYEASEPGPSKIGDTACTACSVLYQESKRKRGGEPSAAVLEELNLHVVCLSCYQRAARRNVATAPRDRKRGYALVPRDTHAAMQGMAMRVVAPVEVGTAVKLVFVPIPSKGRDEYEMMWVTVRSVAKASLRGVLANKPRLFKPSTLKQGSAVDFGRDHIVAVET